MTHAQYRATLAAGGVPRRDIPPVFRYPRPGEEKQKPPAATRAEIRARIPRRG